MRLLSIAPIARGIRKETLTYFSSKDIEAGSLVVIPIRKKEINGIVLESKDVLQNKSIIKEMDFTIKKIVDYDNKASIPSFLMIGAKKVSELSATSIGSVLAALVPKFCFENAKLFFQNRKSDFVENSRSPEILAIQSANNERIDTYKSIIRESFAKKKSILIICPTEQKVLETKENLSKGILDYTLTLSNTKSKKTLEDIHKKISNEKHPLLIIGTFYSLSLIDQSIGTIILEEESSIHYKSKRQPFLDIRLVVREISKALNTKLIYGDRLLSVETLAEIKEGSINEYARIDRRSNHKLQTLIVDMKTPNLTQTNKSKFEVLSDDLKEMIVYSASNNKKILVYASRRGMSSQTLCNDCGTAILCEKCSNPITLHNAGTKRMFLCHHCGNTRDSDMNCNNCQSWNLVSFGIGIERIEEEIKLLGDISIQRVDSDTCKTPKNVRDKIKDFYDSKTVLLCTDLGLQYISDFSFDFVAIPSLDSMLAIPNFRTTERVMHTILDLKNKAKECILIQTRNNSCNVVEYALAGDLESFANEEIKARKTFGYAPYVTTIKLSIEDKKDKVKDVSNSLIKDLEIYNPIIFPAFIKSKKGQVILNIIIKINSKDWPNKDMINILLSLPPNISIDTTPTSLL